MNAIQMIKVKNGIYGIFLALWTACQSQPSATEINQQQIIGEWKSLDNPFGYHFMENGRCENKLGFFTHVFSKGFIAYAPNGGCYELLEYPRFLLGRSTELHNILYFQGNQSSYRIRGDTLSIYEPGRDSWFDQQIRFVSPDTMVLSYTDECNELVRNSFARMDSAKAIDKPAFDQLVFYYPNGYHDERYFSIRHDGTFISYGYKGKKKFFTGKMREGEFERIEALFQKADLSRTKTDLERYYNKWEEPKLAWVKDGQMQSVYAMHTDDDAFYWAYIRTLYSPFTLHLEPVDPASCFRTELSGRVTHFWALWLEQNGHKLSFNQVDKFCLYLRLGQAKVTTQSFEPLYLLKHREENEQFRTLAETDGRYFRYTREDGQTETLDIGVNMAKINQPDTMPIHE